MTRVTVDRRTQLAAELESGAANNHFISLLTATVTTEHERIQVISLCTPWLTYAELFPYSLVKSDLCFAARADHLWTKKLAQLESQHKLDPEAIVDTSDWVDGLPDYRGINPPTGFTQSFILPARIQHIIDNLRVPPREQKRLEHNGQTVVLAKPPKVEYFGQYPVYGFMGIRIDGSTTRLSFGNGRLARSLSSGRQARNETLAKTNLSSHL